MVVVDEGYFVKYSNFNGSSSSVAEQIVVSVHELQLLAEQTFSAEILCKAGIIVDKFLSGEIDQSNYECQRDALAGRTSNPKMMARFMDCHPQRRIQNKHKIQISIA